MTRFLINFEKPKQSLTISIFNLRKRRKRYLGGRIGKKFANFFANWRQMPIGAHINLPIGANFELA